MAQMVYGYGKNCEDGLQRAEGWKHCCKVVGKNSDLGMGALGLAQSLKSYVILYQQ